MYGSWIKTVGALRQTRHRGTARAGWRFTLTAAACNLIRPQAAGGRLTMPAIRLQRPKAGPGGGAERLDTLAEAFFHTSEPGNEARGVGSQRCGIVA
jgi:hypothetical protein